MTLKKSMLLCLALFTLLILPACGSQENGSESATSANQATGTGQSSKANAVSQMPTEAEIQAMLSSGVIDVLWVVGEDSFSPPDTITAYTVEAVNGDAVWNALFSQDDLVLRQQFNEYSDMLITLDGTEYTGRLYNTGLVEFGGLSESPTALSFENVMNALSGFTGMDWTLGEPDDAADTSTYYQFSVDGIMIDRKGYSVGEDSYSGPFASFGSSYVGIYIPFCLEAKGDSLVSDRFVSSEQVKTLCRTDFLAQADFPTIIVFDHAELVYYYQAQQQMLLPAWRITGAIYSLADDGTLSSSTATRLIDAQTGELHW